MLKAKVYSVVIYVLVTVAFLLVFIYTVEQHKERPSTGVDCAGRFSISDEEGEYADEAMRNFFKSVNVNNRLDSVVIKMEGDAISMDGHLSYRSLKDFARLLKNNSEVNTFKISSQGGVTVIGLCFAELIKMRNMDVDIVGEVFSSAANYIFVAGNKKFLHKHSVVGFHGGEASEKFNDLEGEGLTADDSLDSSVLGHKNAIKLESDFYQRNGVDINLVKLGQHEKFSSHAKDRDIVGWTYTLDAMKALGVKNIVPVAGEWAPNVTFKHGGKLFIITEKEVL
ncbi:hypothetical protein [Pantoea sp. 1.19]|uniref:hypothetical protein n=1 Tax=Pantoea sp. 1.19 TaxID=1925589 RepID=UPI0011150C1A|nr:hypothetical protein [Pantoea sp. 1.19]